MVFLQIPDFLWSSNHVLTYIFGILDKEGPCIFGGSAYFEVFSSFAATAEGNRPNGWNYIFDLLLPHLSRSRSPINPKIFNFFRYFNSVIVRRLHTNDRNNNTKRIWDFVYTITSFIVSYGKLVTYINDRTSLRNVRQIRWTEYPEYNFFFFFFF